MSHSAHHGTFSASNNPSIDSPEIIIQNIMNLLRGVRGKDVIIPKVSVKDDADLSDSGENDPYNKERTLQEKQRKIDSYIREFKELTGQITSNNKSEIIAEATAKLVLIGENKEHSIFKDGAVKDFLKENPVMLSEQTINHLQSKVDSKDADDPYSEVLQFLKAATLPSPTIK